MDTSRSSSSVNANELCSNQRSLCAVRMTLIAFTSNLIVKALSVLPLQLNTDPSSASLRTQFQTLFQSVYRKKYISAIHISFSKQVTAFQGNSAELGMGNEGRKRGRIT